MPCSVDDRAKREWTMIQSVQLRPVPCLSAYKEENAPLLITRESKIPLELFLLDGISHHSLRIVQEHPLWNRGSQTYLLQADNRDVCWALAWLQDNTRELREALRSELSSGALKQSVQTEGVLDLHRMSGSELVVLLRRILARQEYQPGESPVLRWHRLLVRHPQLPFLDREETLRSLEGMQRDGLIVKQGQSWYPSGGEDRWILEWNNRRALINPSSSEVNTVLYIHSDRVEEIKLCSVQKTIEWFEQQFNDLHPSRFHITALPADGLIAFPDLGGIGDLHQWEALIGGKNPGVQAEEITQATQQALLQQPPGAWLPGMYGALVSTHPAPEDLQAPVELAHSVQLHNLGSMVHLGCPLQPHRLQRESEPVRLFSPLNPFAQAPAAMSLSLQNP